MKFSIKDFSLSTQARILIFGMQVGDELLHHRIVSQPSLVYIFHLFVLFFSPYFEYYFSSKITPQSFKLESSYLVHTLNMTYYIVGVIGLSFLPSLLYSVLLPFDDIAINEVSEC